MSHDCQLEIAHSTDYASERSVRATGASYLRSQSARAGNVAADLNHLCTARGCFHGAWLTSNGYAQITRQVEGSPTMRGLISTLVLAATLAGLAGTLAGAAPSSADKGGCPNANSANGAAHANPKSAHGPEKQAERGCQIGGATSTPTVQLTATPPASPGPTGIAEPTAPPTSGSTSTPSEAAAPTEAATPTPTPFETPGSTPEPTPTPTPTGEPTPGPTAEPTPTPTPTPAPTPSPSAEPTPEPTPTVTRTPEPTP